VFLCDEIPLLTHRLPASGVRPTQSSAGENDHDHRCRSTGLKDHALKPYSTPVLVGSRESLNFTAIVCLLSVESGWTPPTAALSPVVVSVGNSSTRKIAVMRQHVAAARLLCGELLQVESAGVRRLIRIEIDDIQAPQLIANIWIQHLVDPTHLTN
jgi:hypothetical protein